MRHVSLHLVHLLVGKTTFVACFLLMLIFNELSFLFFKILVWHTRTQEPKMKQERRLIALGMGSDVDMEI